MLLATVKFLFAPFTALGMGFTYFEAALLTSIGGIAGVTIFFWLSEFLAERFKGNPNKKKFTRLNRTIIGLKHRIGIKGLAFIGLPFLSVPISCAIMGKFYKHQAKQAYTYLCVSVLLWSFILPAIYFAF